MPQSKETVRTLRKLQFRMGKLATKYTWFIEHNPNHPTATKYLDQMRQVLAEIYAARKVEVTARGN